MLASQCTHGIVCSREEFEVSEEQGTAQEGEERHIIVLESNALTLGLECQTEMNRVTSWSGYLKVRGYTHFVAART